MRRTLSRLLTCLGALVVLLAAPAAARADALYGAFLDQLYTVDPNSGSRSLVGNIGHEVTGLAYDASTDTLYGTTGNTVSTGASRSLIRINRLTGAGTLVGGLGVALPVGTAAGLTVDPTTGILYGWVTGHDDLFTINPNTGAATKVGESSLASQIGRGLASDGSGTLYYSGAGTSGALRTVNKATGTTLAVAILSGHTTPGVPVSELAFDSSGNLFGSSLDQGTSTIFQINRVTGAITNVHSTAINLDAIVFVAATPEPATLSLFGLGSLGLLAWRRKRKQGPVEQ